MDLEATIVERLQELRKWQMEQQEKLLKQQHEQREQLSIEQERMYEALGLKEIILDDSLLEKMSISKSEIVHSPRKSLNDSNTIGSSLSVSPAVGGCSAASGSVDDRSMTQLSVPALRLTSSSSGLTSIGSTTSVKNGNYEPENNTEGERIGETPRRFQLSSNASVEGVEPLPLENKPSKALAMDDVPVPSPKKDFKTLLEERLRESEATQDLQHDDQKTVIKRPFLRKGEGLARFKPNGNSNNSKTSSSMRPRSASLSAAMPGSRANAKTKDTPKSNKTAHFSRRSVPAMVPPVGQQKLNLKSVPPPKKKARSKSISGPLPSAPKPQKSTENTKKSSEESNTSDLDTSKLETKMFEFLEEKAENSSFCSTSSAVIAFMQQSTPLKLRSIKQKLSTQTVSPVKSTKLQGSPVRAIRETVTQKDIIFSKWDSGPFGEEKNSPSAVSHTQRDVKKIVGPNFQGSQQRNTKILLYHNNNNIEKTNDEDVDVFNISSSTEVSSGEENKRDNYDDNKGENVSMHVRFAEYNEYKTIGLSDTSMISNGSQYHDKDERAWSEHSASSESSDAEVLSKPINVLQHIQKANQQMGNYTEPNVKYPSKPQLPLSVQPRKLQDYDDSTDHSTDDEHSLFNDSEGTNYDEDNTISELQEAVRRTMESYKKKVEETSEVEDVTPTEEHYEPPSQPTVPADQPIFRSELLKTRLLELEREIDIFRKENASLAAQRQKLQEEHRNLLKEFKEKEVNLEKERTRMESGFQEEKKRLAREKAALENRLRDAREKSIQSKQERQEIQLLKEQFDELRDEINEKEQRWQAAQARQKSQMRVLQMENAKLKQEIEKFQAAKRGSAKLKRPGTLSNTKAIHQINKQLDYKKVPSSKRSSLSDDEPEPLDPVLPEPQSEKIASNINTDLITNNETGKVIVYEPSQKLTLTEEEIAKKRNLYQNLLKEATNGFSSDDMFKKNSESCENQKGMQKENAKDTNVIKERLSDPPAIPQNSLQLNKEAKRDTSRSSNNPSVLKSTENIDQPSARGSYQQFVREVINPRIDSKQLYNSEALNHRPIATNQYTQQEISAQIDKPLIRQSEVSMRFEKIKRFSGEVENNPMNSGSLTTRVGQPKFVTSNESELTPRKQHQDPMPMPAETPRAEPISISHLSDLTNPEKAGTPQNQKGVREVHHPDGYTEYWYPNGNVKKVYHDRNISKMIYYNGDVRETTEDGCIKYFYAATKTWHTTYPDGFEILEFPDGQEERRTTDGVVEVSFPDGSIRLMQPDGVEKWALPDGTIAETFPNGDKILSLPNGQREIHTKDHKRREYPDGTVKYVYPDGTQETRYSNGRIRVKDKDGNLIMDSHQA